MQIASVIGKTDNLSNDIIMSNHIRNYYNTLGTFLNIEPLIQSNNMQYNSNKSPEIIQELNSDDDDDEAPNLV